jgi:hypothetical protein
VFAFVCFCLPLFVFAVSICSASLMFSSVLGRTPLSVLGETERQLRAEAAAKLQRADDLAQNQIVVDALEEELAAQKAVAKEIANITQTTLQKLNKDIGVLTANLATRDAALKATEDKLVAQKVATQKAAEANHLEVRNLNKRVDHLAAELFASQAAQEAAAQVFHRNMSVLSASFTASQAELKATEGKLEAHQVAARKLEAAHQLELQHLRDASANLAAELAASRAAVDAAGHKLAEQNASAQELVMTYQSQVQNLLQRAQETAAKLASCETSLLSEKASNAHLMKTAKSDKDRMQSVQKRADSLDAQLTARTASLHAVVAEVGRCEEALLHCNETTRCVVAEEETQRSVLYRVWENAVVLIISSFGAYLLTCV